MTVYNYSMSEISEMENLKKLAEEYPQIKRYADQIVAEFEELLRDAEEDGLRPGWIAYHMEMDDESASIISRVIHVGDREQEIARMKKRFGRG